jgi:hypothetical protein
MGIIIRKGIVYGGSGGPGGNITAEDIGALPIVGGGYITDNIDDQVLGLNANTDGDGVFIDFQKKGVRVGQLGFKKDGEPKFVDAAGNWRDILSTANKPSGSYVGTGATRVVNTGGIGSMLLVYAAGTDAFAIVTSQGAVVKDGLTLSTTQGAATNFKDGVLNINASNGYYNNAGLTYYYHVI